MQRSSAIGYACSPPCTLGYATGRRSPASPASPQLCPKATSRGSGRYIAPQRPALCEHRLHFGQRLVEDRDREIDVRARHRQRRRNAPYRAALGTPANVHAEAECEAALGRQRAQLVPRLACLAIPDELDAAQKAHAADIADLLVARLELLEARGEVVAHLAASREQVLLRHRLEHREADRRRQ